MSSLKFGTSGLRGLVVDLVASGGRSNKSNVMSRKGAITDAAKVGDQRQTRETTIKRRQAVIAMSLV